jgi:hypothetical protein
MIAHVIKATGITDLDRAADPLTGFGVGFTGDCGAAFAGQGTPASAASAAVSTGFVEGGAVNAAT